MGTAPRWPSGGMKHLKLGPFVNSWQEAENTYWGNYFFGGIFTSTDIQETYLGKYIHPANENLCR